ncbi:MAG: 5'-methylthioadenosine/adenosylhomocysteine nucleosidase [Salinibacter sp.]
MAVAVISAMAEEIEMYLDTCTVDAARDRAGLRLHEAHHHGHDLVLVRAGVGKVNAALCTQLLIDDYPLDAVVCTGSAGALHDGLAIGDIVVAEDCVQHDLHVEFLGLERGAIPFSDLRFFSAARPLVRRAQAVSLDDHSICTGRVCTGDTFIQDETARRHIHETLGGDCVEMEGAAVGQVCTLNEVPFLLVRAISDRADGSSDVDFPSFLREAAQASARIVLRLLAGLDAGSLRART